MDYYFVMPSDTILISHYYSAPNPVTKYSNREEKKYKKKSLNNYFNYHKIT